MLLRWRIKIVNGESYESEVFKDQDLADQITETLRRSKAWQVMFWAKSSLRLRARLNWLK